MTRDPHIWTPERTEALLLADEFATARRALEELVRDVDVANTCERLELELYRLNGEGPKVEQIRDVIDLLRHLAESGGD